MKLLSLIFVSLASLGCVLATAVDSAAVNATSHWPWPPKRCNPKAKGLLLPLLQEEAIQEFGRLWLVEYDIQSAWDRWIPGEFIQHHFDAVGDRQNAIDFLKTNFHGPGKSVTNITIFSGGGYGVLHYKWISPEITYAISDRLRFEGTCMVEHWDVIQTITGKEPNPRAFF